MADVEQGGVDGVDEEPLARSPLSALGVLHLAFQELIGHVWSQRAVERMPPGEYVAGRLIAETGGR